MFSFVLVNMNESDLLRYDKDVNQTGLDASNLEHLLYNNLAFTCISLFFSFIIYNCYFLSILVLNFQPKTMLNKSKQKLETFYCIYQESGSQQ